ncbi:DUF202 domain-containing protein [Rhodococcus sp. NPDC003348]
MSVAPGVRADPGLQPERTALSWVRTAAALAALAVLVVRCLPGPGWASAAVGGVALLGALVLLGTARGRHQRSCEDFEMDCAPPQWGWNVLLLGAVLVPAAAGAVIVAAAAA